MVRFKYTLNPTYIVIIVKRYFLFYPPPHDKNRSPQNEPKNPSAHRWLSCSYARMYVFMNVWSMYLGMHVFLYEALDSAGVATNRKDRGILHSDRTRPFQDRSR